MMGDERDRRDYYITLSFLLTIRSLRVRALLMW